MTVACACVNGLYCRQVGHRDDERCAARRAEGHSGGRITSQLCHGLSAPLATVVLRVPIALVAIVPLCFRKPIRAGRPSRLLAALTLFWLLLLSPLTLRISALVAGTALDNAVHGYQ